MLEEERGKENLERNRTGRGLVSPSPMRGYEQLEGKWLTANETWTSTRGSGDVTDTVLRRGRGNRAPASKSYMSDSWQRGQREGKNDTKSNVFWA